MQRRLTAQAAGLEEAVRRLLAELAGTDIDEVKVRLDVPGLELDDLGDVRLELRYEEAATAEYEDEDGDEDEQEAPPSRAAREDEDDDEDEDDEGPSISLEDLDEEADAAADFLEGLLDALDLPGDLQIRVHEDHAEVEVVNVGSGRLIGRRGQTLDAIQELLRCALQRQFERRARVMIDVEGYRKRRLEKFLEKAQEAIEEVRASGEPQRLEPMDVYERKAVHQLVAQHDGVASSSRGREPTRRVVIETD